MVHLMHFWKPMMLSLSQPTSSLFSRLISPSSSVIFIFFCHLHLFTLLQVLCFLFSKFLVMSCLAEREDNLPAFDLFRRSWNELDRCRAANLVRY